MKSSDFYASLPSLAFAATALAIILNERQKKKNGSTKDGSTTTTISMTREEVLVLRQKHFMKAVSISYANSGGLMIMGGFGSRLIGDDGTSYLDTRNNVAHVGHGNPAVVKAIQAQVAVLNTNTRYLHPNAVQLAKKLAGKLPDPLEVVVFVNSGSEANDLALRLARAHTGSKNCIVVDRAYHGHTCSVLEVSPYKYEDSNEFKLVPNGQYGTPGKHIYKVPCPDIYRGSYRNPKTAGEIYSAYVKDACKHYQNAGEKVGAFFIEGGMSVAGVILPPTNYLRRTVEAVRAAGGVYIADEVQTGFGRLGSSYWAFQHGTEDVVPDIVTVGKPFGNGMPLAAVITTREIADSFQAMGVEYFNTFGGNPVCCAAGLAVLDVIEKEGLQQHALEVGTYLKSLFLELKEETVLIGDVRGSGLFIGIELVRDSKTLEPATAETSFICTRLKDKNNILTSIDGADDNVLVVKPPMVFSKKDADAFVKCFGSAMKDLHAAGNDVLQMKKTPTFVGKILPIMRIFALAFLSAVTAFAPTSRTSFRAISSLQMGKSQDELKKEVGYKAVDDYVKSGMVVGLGTGSTAYFAVERVGEKLKSGELKDIVCIPTSVRTKEQAESLDIPLVTLDTHSNLDVSIDGADEVDPDLNLVKGGGGALLREKMVEIMSEKFIVIVDESKLCDGLGPGFPVPVEITPFCHEHTMRQVAALPSCDGCKPVLRMGSSSSNVNDGDEIAVTDNGNYIVDLHFDEPIKDARKMATDVKNICGVVDHGLFCDMSTVVIIAGADGVSVKKP